MPELKKKNKQAAFTNWFGPLLNALRELGGSGRPKEVVEEIAKKEKISDSQREEVIKSGILRFDNQVAWARQYLVWEGLLDNSKKCVCLRVKIHF
ncbi:winged helix-turn-helix domain-containing protein [uncultured Chryseobacterium sp.]|uniref:winged helix-turn-helix domain-containing protein n=1 Tax=uncultured Chryseobacterium sp. TaxID=259322 RepID=UPI0025E234CB|nr:winged helix-turn-helix domain-containing protein [uncultured Chryseobacterium sp.]